MLYHSLRCCMRCCRRCRRCLLRRCCLYGRRVFHGCCCVGHPLAHLRARARDRVAGFTQASDRHAELRLARQRTWLHFV